MLIIGWKGRMKFPTIYWLLWKAYGFHFNLYFDIVFRILKKKDSGQQILSFLTMDSVYDFHFFLSYRFGQCISVDFFFSENLETLVLTQVIWLLKCFKLFVFFHKECGIWCKLKIIWVINYRTSCLCLNFEPGKSWNHQWLWEFLNFNFKRFQFFNDICL